MKRYVDIDQLVDIERFDYNVEPCVETVPIHRLINFYVCDPSTVEIADVRAVMASAWIPVTERLPEEGKAVLIVDESGWMNVASFEYRGKAVWEDRRGYWIDFDEIVAWMPLPEPYRGDK